MSDVRIASNISNMTTLRIPVNLTVDDLLAAVEQLPPEALADFVQRVIALQERQQQSKPGEDGELISALAAQQAADQALCGDLVDCPFQSDKPMLIPEPVPRWRIPFRTPDGTLLTIIEVEATTGAVWLSEEKRKALFEQIEGLPT